MLDNPIADQIITANFAHSFSAPENTFSEPEGESLSFTYSVNPPASWLSFDNDAVKFSGTPMNADANAYTVTLTASDPNAFVTDTADTFKITVVTNSPPSLDNALPTNLALTVPATFAYTVPANTFSEPDRESITYSYSVSPSASWLTFDPDTRTFGGFLEDNTVAGSFSITVHADDPNAEVATADATLPLQIHAN